MATRSVLQRDDAAVRRNYALRLKQMEADNERSSGGSSSAEDSKKAVSKRTSVGAGRNSVVKTNTTVLPSTAVNVKSESRSSGDVSYDLSVLSDRRNSLTEELSKLSNGTGRFTDEGKSRISEIESELKSIGSQEKALDAELDNIKETETQALIDSGEYRKADLYDLTVNSFNQGRYNSKYGQESYKAMAGTENEKETYEEILAGEDYKYIVQNPFAKAVSGMSGFLGQQFQQLTDKRTMTAGLAGAGAGAGMALAAGQAGPQVLLPEEALTVPGGAFAGFVTGMNAGSAAVNFEIEAGLAYNEMIANGVSEETARNIALGVGGANAALEAIQLDELTDAFKITKKTEATQNVAKSLAEEIVKRTGGVLKESAQETAQEGVTIAGAQIGSKLDTGKWAYNSGEVTQRLGDTARSSALSFGLLNLPGTAANISAMQQQLADMQFQKRLNELAAVYEKNVGVIEKAPDLDGSTVVEYDEFGKSIDLLGAMDAAQDLKPQSLMDELANSGVKYNPVDVIIVTHATDGKLLWLEQGNNQSGLTHILERHAGDFASQGVEEIPQLLNRVLKVVPVKTGRSAKGLYADFVLNGNAYRVAYGTNGYIVSFFPITYRED